MGMARHEIIDDSTEGTYHCISRCVRRAYLCGFDVLTGKILRRASALREAGFDASRPDWEEQLERQRVSEADRKAEHWNPRDYIKLDDTAVIVDPEGSRVIGEIAAVSERRILGRGEQRTKILRTQLPQEQA